MALSTCSVASWSRDPSANPAGESRDRRGLLASRARDGGQALEGGVDAFLREFKVLHLA
jgi:hypothetical protein